ncbi:MAG: YwmB family TATA-box binding protein [Lachnospiraceae bacterium]|nr:YwmB family TATA-box binding protein [Lachnospiraceae bacterium]
MTKKIKISFLMVVWSIVAIQVYINHQEKTQRQSQTVTAFSVVQEQTGEALISGYGYFGTMELSGETRETMLVNLANKLGITDGYTFQDGEGEDFEKKLLVKEGKQAVTTLQLISMLGSGTEPDQYIVMEIRTRQNMEAAVSLYQRMKRVYEEIGVDGDVNLEITLEQDGNASLEEPGGLTEQIFALTQAKEVDSIQKDGIATIYGYTKKEDSYLKWNGKKVNLQVAMYYDEEQDKSYVKIGVPIVNTSY